MYDYVLFNRSENRYIEIDIHEKMEKGISLKEIVKKKEK
jgi:hypothetical protein